MATLATLVVKLVGDIDGFSSSIESAGRQVSQFGRNIGQVGQDMTARVTAPILGVGTAAVIMGNQFNAGMANVVSLVPSAADEIAGLRGGVQDLAVEMGQSTGDMTAGLYQVVSAFGYSAESMDLLRISAMAGAAGLATTTDAINLVSAVTRGYGDTSAAAAQQAADLALRTVQLGQTTFPELAASIGRVIPLAANLGVTQQELFAVMAAGTGVTGTASEVSTQLRGVLQSLMAPTSTMTTLISSLGYANGAAMLESLGLQGAIQAIVGAAEASGTPLQAYMGSIEGQTLAMALAGPLADDYASKLEQMGMAAGTAEQAFAAQTQGVNAAGFAMQQAAIRGQVLMENLGNALGPVVLVITGYLERFVSWLGGVLDMFTALDPQTQAIIFGVIGLVAAIGPLLMILGPLVTGFGLVVTAIGALLSPIGLVIVAVALLAAAVVQHFGGVRETIQAASNFVQGILQALSGFIQGNQAEAMGWVDWAWSQIRSIVENMVNGVQAIVQAVLTVVGGFIDRHGAEIMAFVSNAWQQIGRIVNLALELINIVVTTVLAGIAQFINQHGAEIQAILTAAWNMIRSLIQIALDLIEGIIRVALAIIRGDWEQAWTEVRTLVENLWASIQTYIESAVQFVINLVTMLVNTVIEWFTNLYNRLVGGSIIPDMVNGILRWFGTLRERVIEFVRQLVERGVELISELRDRVLSIVSGLAGGMAERGAGMVRAFADGIMGALNSALDAARRLVQQIRDLLPGSDAKSGPLSDITDAGRSLPETLAGAIERGAPSAVSAVADLAGGLMGILTMDTASLGMEAGLNWIEAMIKAVSSRLPALEEVTGAAWGMMRPGQPQLALAGAQGAGRPSAADGGGGPVTINMYGPWHVREDRDIEEIGRRVADYLTRETAITKRMVR